MINLQPFREHETRDVELPPHVVSELIEAAGDALSVAATARPGWWSVQTSSYVGAISLPSIEVLIRPKLAVENLFALLDVGMPDSSWRDEVFGFAGGKDLLPAFAAFFARTVDRLTARGLLRSYRPDSDRLLALRGRIDFPEQLRQPGQPSPIACRFDKFTTDVTENRYLLGAVERLLRLPGLEPATRGLLQHARSRFEGVEGHLPAPSAFDRIHFTRLNEHYRPALRLAQMVAADVTLVDRVGQRQASTFLLDMNELFERFVTERLRRALRGRLSVDDQVHRHLGEKRRVSIYPDLELRRGEQVVYVGDVKYKLTSSGQARTSDYYQLLAYTTILGLREGILIYAQTDDAEPHHEIVVQNAKTRLITYRLDLAGNPADIETSVGNLADLINRRSIADEHALTGPAPTPVAI